MNATASTQLAVHVRAVTKTFGTGEAAVPALKGVDFTARQGELLMIVGPSGCGKSSMLRAIAGLRDEGQGTLLRPALKDLLFLPQQPYMILGTLREQLCYPRLEIDPSDEELLSLAERGQLSKPDVLKAQVHRMVADPRGISLTRDFAFQWLNIAKMDSIVPSAALFQHASGVYDPRPALKKELQARFDEVNVVRPQATRESSYEVYVLGKGYRGARIR